VNYPVYLFSTQRDLEAEREANCRAYLPVAVR
jgi:hypothetical protein